MITGTKQQLPDDLVKIGFQVEITQDGSPTLRLPESGESMHHSGGAAAETRYIYGGVLDQAHQILPVPCKTCVVGLGLGYIEIAWAISLIKNDLKPSPEISFHSFEIVPELIQNFKVWLETEVEIEDSIYNLVIEKLAPTVSIRSIKGILLRALKSGSTLNGDVMDEKNHREKYQVICYDAFSQKTSGPLWSPDFLKNFVEKSAAENCILTTYACTGVLRKTLIEQKFDFYKRLGFCGKRDSSLAVRGIFKLEDFRPTTSQTFSYTQ